MQADTLNDDVKDTASEFPAPSADEQPAGDLAPSAEEPAAKDEKQGRPPRLLWVCPYCLLDTSSGASIDVREMLVQLRFRGFEIGILSATIFDVPRGRTRLKEHLKTIEKNQGKFISVQDAPLVHNVLVTKSTNRGEMTSKEQDEFYAHYVALLDQFKPDMIYFYGGGVLDMLVQYEAKMRGIPVAAYLANGNYYGTRWCRDVDVIITNSMANARMYKERCGFDAVPVWCFIDRGKVLAEGGEHKRVLVVNPSLAKGIGIVVELAVMMEKRRPDIIFEIVESRGDWPAILKAVSRMLGQSRATLKNVVVTRNTFDMREIYGRARLLLAPSLGWEAFGRVAIEAMINGIPAIVTNRGGLPEAIGDGGVKVNFPEEFYEEPYNRIPPKESLEPLAREIERMFDDEAYYAELCRRAQEQGKKHGIEGSTDRLIHAFIPLLQKAAGDRKVEEDASSTSNPEPAAAETSAPEPAPADQESAPSDPKPEPAAPESAAAEPEAPVSKPKPARTKSATSRSKSGASRAKSAAPEPETPSADTPKTGRKPRQR